MTQVRNSVIMNKTITMYNYSANYSFKHMAEFCRLNYSFFFFT